jgi:hypothetical protein
MGLKSPRALHTRPYNGQLRCPTDWNFHTHALVLSHLAKPTQLNRASTKWSHGIVTRVTDGASFLGAAMTFSPTATGSVTGTLTFTDSAVTSPQVVTLSGTGR